MIESVHSSHSDQAQPTPRLVANIARTQEEIRESQRLRHQVFVEEMGAESDCSEAGLEYDAFDDHCDVVTVRETSTNTLIASTRLLPHDRVAAAGSFYSESEFDLSRILAQPGRILEIGRTCVHPDFRTGAAIGVLWAGLARYLSAHQFDYLLGCASIGINDGGVQASAIMRKLQGKYLSPPQYRVTPKQPFEIQEVSDRITPLLPPLLKAYLRLGCWICGEPCVDEKFKVVDVLVLLQLERLNQRYLRHFFGAEGVPVEIGVLSQ